MLVRGWMDGWGLRTGWGEQNKHLHNGGCLASCRSWKCMAIKGKEKQKGKWSPEVCRLSCLPCYPSAMEMRSALNDGCSDIRPEAISRGSRIRPRSRLLQTILPKKQQQTLIFYYKILITLTFLRICRYLFKVFTQKRLR